MIEIHAPRLSLSISLWVRKLGGLGAHGLLHKGGEVRDTPGLRVVLDDVPASGDDVDGREGLGVQVGLDEIPLLVSPELGDGNVELLGQLLVLLLHGLAELAPGRVNLS